MKPNLDNLLKSKGLKRKDIYPKLNIQRGTFDKYCTGEHQIPNDVLLELSKILNTSCDSILIPVKTKTLTEEQLKELKEALNKINDLLK